MLPEVVLQRHLEPCLNHRCPPELHIQWVWVRPENLSASQAPGRPKLLVGGHTLRASAADSSPEAGWDVGMPVSSVRYHGLCCLLTMSPGVLRREQVRGRGLRAHLYVRCPLQAGGDAKWGAQALVGK